MKKTTLTASLTTLMLLGISIDAAYAQITYAGVGVTFEYDNAGNRVVRKMQTICIGLGCPPIVAEGPAGRPAPADDTVVAGKKAITDEQPPTDGQPVLVRTKVEAYPNPVDQDLFIDNKTWTGSDNATVVVLDMNGKMILKQQLTQAKESVPFRDLVPGIYIVHYYLNEVPAEVWRIIKK